MPTLTVVASIVLGKRTGREIEVDEEQCELGDNSRGTNQHERGSFHP